MAITSIINGKMLSLILLLVLTGCGGGSTPAKAEYKKITADEAQTMISSASVRGGNIGETKLIK